MMVGGEEEDGQFEQVLTRLDALMQRGHVSSPAETPVPEAPLEEAAGTEPIEGVAEIPVLTEVFYGIELLPVIDLEQELPRTTNGPVAESPFEIAAPISVLPEPVAPSREAEADFVLAELMPDISEMIRSAVQQELSELQLKLSSRLCQEAEQVLRQRLLETTKPK